jgi:hypothetical protein
MPIFTVSNLNDSGAGSLRAAITAANASGTPAVINFSVNGTITLASALPAVSNTVAIDATSAPSYVNGGPPVVALNFNGNAGLVFATGSANSALLGVAVDNANGNGVTLNDGSITLNNDYIGLNLAGAAAGNSGDGVYVSATSSNNRIGLNPTSSLGTTAAAGVVANVISGNGGNGISFHGSTGNVVVANRIGTDPTGTTAIANGGNGIWITDGSNNNVIGGSAYIDSTTGVANNPTGSEGNGTPTFVAPPLGNLISGNGQTGVLIDTGSQANVLSGNFIGTTAAGNSALGNALDGVWINGANGNSLIGTTLLNPPGSPNPGTLNTTPFNFYNVLSGNGGNGLQVTNSDNVTVQANFLGAAANNAGVVPNKLNGILVDGSSQDTTVGGVIPLGNVASGNLLNGIDVADTASGFVSFNTFGGGLAFGSAAPNGNDGLLITSDDSSGAGPNVAQTNVFSGNTNNGIELAGNATGADLEPNIVGLTTGGDAPLPNGGDGLLITGTAHDNTIGGPVTLPPGNSIIPNQAFSGNDGYGIAIVGQAYDNLIEPENFVGTGVSGIGPPVNPLLGNGAGGILIGGTANNNTIGGVQGSPDLIGATSNLIDGNSGNGITVLPGASNNSIVGNTIGLDQLGVPLRNTGSPIVQLIGTGTSSGKAALVGQSTVQPVGPTSVQPSGEAFPQTGGQLVFGEVNVDNQGQAISVSQTTVPIAQMGAAWTAFGMADFNGDGNSDALWYATSGADLGQVAIWLLNGSHVIGYGIPTGQMGAGWQVAGTGDFNGDGDADILWHAETGSDAGAVAVWTMSGTTLVSDTISNGTIGAEWNPVAIGDFYGTGRSAILWESNTGALADWSMDGSTATTQSPAGQIGTEWRVAGVGHFNGIGNGDPTGDIVWVDNNNDVQIWQMTNGQIGQVVTPDAQAGADWTLQGVGDYTQSGASELWWLNSNGQSTIWQLNGAQVTQISTVSPPAGLTGDGLSDLLMTSTATGVLVLDELSGGQMTYQQIGGLGPEWQFEGSAMFLGDGKDGELLWNSNSGAMVVAEDNAGTAQYTAIGGVGPEWQFEGNGALLGQATNGFLLWNSDSGALVVGSVAGGAAQYTQIGGIGSEWQFEGTGNYLDDDRTGFLIENTAGTLVVGEVVGGAAQYTAVGGLGSEWQFEGTGNLLGHGQDDFLIRDQNTGALVVGEVANGSAQYTQIGAVGPEWQFLGVGDYDGASTSEFVMRNSNTGALVLGTVSGGAATYTAVGGVGLEWNFHTDHVATVA